MENNLNENVEQNVTQEVPNNSGKKSNKGVIAILIVIIFILAVLCLLFATNTISFKSKTTSNETNNSSDTTVEETTENVLISEDEAINIVKELYNDDVRFIFNQMISYCGEYAEGENTTISINGFTYRKSASFKTLEELENHLKKYMTESLLNNTDYNRTTSIDGNEVTSYYEKDGALYCNGWNKGSNMDLGKYLVEKSEFEISNIEEDSFKAHIKAAYSELNSEKVGVTLSINVTVIKENGNWLLSGYQEVNE